MDEGERRLDRWTVAAIACFAVAVRVWLAWENRFCIKPDFTVVALIAKHMAEGVNYPIYLYGQHYLGTFEPAVSGISCALFGCNEFTVSLGTALCGFLALPVVYLWARDVGGRTAGVAALVFLVIGPVTFAFYSVISVGSYAITFFFSPLLLWMTGRLVDRELRGETVPATHFLLLGFIAGVAWWSYQIILTTLAAAVLLLLGWLRLRALRPRLVAAGVLGFFVGSLPFWWWNLAHGWATFRLARSFRPPGFVDQLGLVLGTRLPQVLSFPETLRTPMLVLLAGAVVVFVGFGFRRSEAGRPRIQIAGILLFFVVHVLVLSLSHFGGFRTERYLLPLVPAFAVVLGVATAALGTRRTFYLGWVGLALFVVPQVQVFPQARALSRGYRESQEAAREVADVLEREDIDVVYTGYESWGLNFALRERFVFTDVRGGRYAPHGVAAERADRIGALGDHGGLTAFVAESGGTVTVTPLPGRFASLHHGLAPPPPALGRVPGPRIVSIVDGQGQDMKDALLDDDSETWWRGRRPYAPEHLEIAFGEPTEVTGLRLVPAFPGSHPGHWRLEGRGSREGPWEFLVDGEMTLYFWSGPRPFWAGRSFRIEPRFAPRTVTDLRLVFTGRPRFGWALAEIDVLAPPFAIGPPLAASDLPELLAFLERRGIERLYTDRWEATRIHAATEGRVLTSLDRDGDEEEILPQLVRLTPRTGLLLREDEASECREAMTARRLRWTETEIGPWLVLHFGTDDWHERYADHAGLLWAGVTCLRAESVSYARGLVLEADSLRDDPELARELLEETLAIDPGYGPAREALDRLSPDTATVR